MGTRRLVAAAIIVALAIVVGRMLVDSRAALHAGQAAEARGDTVEAIRSYFEAARLYAPGSPYVRRALDRLEGVANGAQTAHQAQTERRALEAIRAALLGTRSFYTPHAERLPEVERRLARLYAESEDPRVDPGASARARLAWHAQRLARRPGPHAGYVLLALTGLGGWLGGAALFATRGLDGGLRLRRGPALVASAVFAVGFALFLVGLRLA